MRQCDVRVEFLGRLSSFLFFGDCQQQLEHVLLAHGFRAAQQTVESWVDLGVPGEDVARVRQCKK